MVFKEYILLESEYLKLAKVLLDLSARGNMIRSSRSNEAAFLIDRTGVLFHYYDGIAALGARRLAEIRQTASLLEERAGIKLMPKTK